MINVTFKQVSLAELNFSVTIQSGSNISQVLLFGVDTWDQDGSPGSTTATGFTSFTNPTMPPYGTQDVFKCSWIATNTAFNNGTRNGFVVELGNQSIPASIQWFAYVVSAGAQVPTALTGWATLAS
jgi:hypothetical protein